VNVIGEHYLMWNKPGSEKDNMSCIYAKDRSNTNTSSIIYTNKYVQNMFPKVRLLEDTKGGGKEEDNDREWIILKYLTSV
jgi:hypothetical protein